jgi:hypothetical protein
MAEIHKPEVIGVNVIQAMQTAKARVAPTTTYPPLKDALPAWLDAQERKGDLLPHRQIATAPSICTEGSRRVACTNWWVKVFILVSGGADASVAVLHF